MKKINILVLLFVAIIANAQTISGKILSKQDQKPIPYAKIGVEGENIGAIADKDGDFSLNFDNIDRNKFVKIEVASFEGYKTPVSDFVKNNPQNILLEEKVRAIAEVTIKQKKLVDKNWGVNTKTKSLMYNVDPEKGQNFLGEFALAFSTDKRAKIQKINLNVAKINTAQPIIINYVVYNSKNGLPGEVLNDYRFEATLSADKIVDDVFSLDVSKESVWVGGDFFVSMQVMAPFKGNLKISSAPFKVGFMREYFGNWRKEKMFAPAINIDVKVDKSAQNKPIEQGENIGVLNNIEEIQRDVEEAKASKFGKNEVAGNLVHFKDHDTYYETYGEGEPLFLLHGNNSNMEVFYKQIDEFSKYYKVYTVDTRAQGKSTDFTKEKLTYEQFAEDLKLLTDALQLKKINILGWSDGGIVGLLYNLKFPENVNKLAVMGANLNPNGVIDEIIEDAKRNIKNKSEDFNLIRLRSLVAFQPNIKPKDLAKIKNPVLIIAGENDVVKKEHTKLIHKSIPNSQFLIIKDAGHYAPWEQPEAFNKAVLGFFRF